jgi:ADP-ribose pyrophosphatase YjhB (NUDIX family)
MHLNNTYHFCPRCGITWDTPEATSRINNHISCTNCEFILYQDPKVAVCVIIEINGKIVMIKRRLPTEKGDWAIPGGFVDAGESVETAAIREVKEEILIDITITKLIGVYSRNNDPVILIVYEGKTKELNPGCGVEAVEVALFGYTAIPWKDLSFFANREALMDYFAMKKG